MVNGAFYNFLTNLEELPTFAADLSLCQFQHFSCPQLSEYQTCTEDHAMSTAEKLQPHSHIIQPSNHNTSTQYHIVSQAQGAK